MPRKSAKDTITGQVAAANRPEVVYAVPVGLGKLSKAEQIAWDQWTTAKDSWKASELRGLHQLVKMESELLDLECESRISPAIIEKINGDLAAHPIHDEVKKQRKMIQAQLRVLGLNSPHTVAVKNAGEGQAVPVSQGRGKKPKLSLLS